MPGTKFFEFADGDRAPAAVIYLPDGTVWSGGTTSETADDTLAELQTLSGRIGPNDTTKEIDPDTPANINARLSGLLDRLAALLTIHEGWDADTSAAAVTPFMGSGGNGSVTTAATGTNWTTLTGQACKQVTLSNDTGTDLVVRQDGAGVGFVVISGTYYTFYGLSNANQLQVQRQDQSNSQVTATYRWES